MDFKLNLSRKSKLFIFLFFLVIIFALFSIIYTHYYYKALKNQGDYLLYKDIVYDLNNNSDPSYTSLDIYVPDNNTIQKYPVMIYVHGGAWTKYFGNKDQRGRYIQKGLFYTDNNFILVNVNYRSSPNSNFPVPVQDVTTAIDWVYNNISNYLGNEAEIYLSGHSAGAQIVSLISTDESYLQKYGLDLNIIKGTVLLEGVGYDLLLPSSLKFDSKLIEMYYNVPFGNDENTYKNASPINHVSKNKNIPPMILFVCENSIFRIAKPEAKNFYYKLIMNNVYARYYVISDRGHSSLNYDFGKEDDRTSQLTMEFIEEIKKLR